MEVPSLQDYKNCTLIIKYTQTEHSHDGYCSDPGEKYETLNGEKIKPSKNKKLDSSKEKKMYKKKIHLVNLNNNLTTVYNGKIYIKREYYESFKQKYLPDVLHGNGYCGVYEKKYSIHKMKVFI